MIEKRYLIKEYNTNCGKEYLFYMGKDCVIIGKYGALPIGLGIEKKVKEADVLEYGYKTLGRAKNNKFFGYGRADIVEVTIELSQGTEPKTVLIDTVIVKGA